MNIAITRLLPLYPNKVFFQWDLINPTEDGAYLFDIYRAGSDNGPWELLSSSQANIYNYLDTIPTTGTNDVADPNFFQYLKHFHYRVDVTPPSGSVNKQSVISSIEPRLPSYQTRMRRKIVRDLRVQLNKHDGVDVAVSKRMRWGPRCPKCYDKKSKEVIRGSCKTCFSTSIMPGYFTPIITKLRRSVTAVTSTVTPQATTDVNITSATMPGVPLITDGDVVTFLDNNKRFLVMQLTGPELRIVTVHQKIQMSELSKTAIEYYIPVDPLRAPRLF